MYTKDFAMKRILQFLLIFSAFANYAQIKVEVTPNGINPNPVQETLPDMSDERFIELSQIWASEFSRGEYDITEVTANSLTIDAFRDNAFLYRNKGETFLHNVKYQLKIEKTRSGYTSSFKILEIHAKKVILQSTIADYFLPNGNLKEGFEEVKPSLERSINIILNSYDRYLKTTKS
jgi:hypothetical protein